MRTIMPFRISTIAIPAGLLLTVLALHGPVASADQARQIPGITGKDTFPNGCIDCHTSTSKGGDTRIGTLMGKWTTAVEPALLEKTKAAAADPAKVKGKHPPVPRPGSNVPQSCLAACHKKGSTIAPAFATLIHTLHLTGAQNQFMAQFQGECTHCHKLDARTGAWRMPTGAEK